MEVLKKAGNVLMGAVIGFLLGWFILNGMSNLEDIWKGFLDALS